MRPKFLILAILTVCIWAVSVPLHATSNSMRMHNGSTVSKNITDRKEKACAELFANNFEDVDVHFVKKESFWGGKYSVWYRERYQSYSDNSYSVRKCQVKGGSVSILSVFETWR